jgi:glutamate 5-kinase
VGVLPWLGRSLAELGFSRKWWIAHGLHAAGTVVLVSLPPPCRQTADGSRIDEGALRAIKRRESGGRLLPAGVVRIEGIFASHQAVRLVVRRRIKFQDNDTDHTDVSRPTTPNSSRQKRFEGDHTGPITPNILPAMSMSSSIISLDPLSRSSPKMMEEEGWEEVEVGKGLAQYNSVEIDRIKGMKRWVRSKRMR